MNLRKLAPLALAAVLLTGCGDSKSNSSSPNTGGDDKDSSAALAKVKPCDLVTQAEAEAAYGGTLAAAIESNDLVKSCLFGSAGAPFSDNVQVQVQTLTVFKGSKAVTKEQSETYGYTITPIVGIGEDAFIQETKNASGAVPAVMVAFEKNGVAIYTSVNKKGFTNQQATDAARQLAQKAVGRVPAN
jgi:hypothetical protein